MLYLIHTHSFIQQIIPPTNRFNTQLLDLLKKLLTFDPKDRITAKEALDHPWFSEALQDDGTAVAMLPRNKIHILRPGTRPPLTDNTWCRKSFFSHVLQSTTTTTSFNIKEVIKSKADFNWWKSASRIYDKDMTDLGQDATGFDLA